MTEAMQRIAKNPPKIRSRRVSRTSQIGLGTLPEHPWAETNHIWRNRWPKSCQNCPYVALKSLFWDPSRTQRFTKKRPGGEKVFPQRLLDAVMDQFRIDLGGEHRFSQISHRFQIDFSWNSSEKNCAFFHCRACFFQHGDPHDSMYFTYRKLPFHVLLFDFFVPKDLRKHAKKRISKEHRKMMPDAPKMDPRLTPNLFILTENARGETQNLQKWLPKVVFGSIKFWGQILNGKRSEKSGAGVPAMAPAPYTHPRGPTTVFQEQM